MSNKENDKRINAPCCSRCGAILQGNGLPGHVGPRRHCPRCLSKIKVEASRDELSSRTSELVRFHTISRTPETVAIGDFASQTEITVKKTDIPMLIATLRSFSRTQEENIMNRIQLKDYEKLYRCAEELQLFIHKLPKTGSLSCRCMPRLRDEFEASTTYSFCEQVINEASLIIERSKQ